jgi:hypothetical protein
VSAGKTTCKQLKKMTGSNVRAAETGCRSSVLHIKTNSSIVVESYCERKTARCRRGSRISISRQLLTSFISNIVYLQCIFYSTVDTALL